MPNNNRSENNEHELNLHSIPSYKSVDASRGPLWIKSAYKLFIVSKGAWFAIGAFLLVGSMITILSTLIVVFMPLLVGGLMIGCNEASPTSPMKFDSLFSGLRKNARALIALSLINSLSLMIASTFTFYISALLGFDLNLLVPNIENGDSQALIAWLQAIDPALFIKTFLAGIFVFFIIMMPVFMAFWFAPILVCLRKTAPIDSLILSFKANIANIKPFFTYGLVAISYLLLFFFVLSIVAAVAQLLVLPLLIIGYVIILSITLLTIYTSYSDIFEEKSLDHNNQPTSKKEPDNDGSDNNSNGSMIA